jgi:hypothetical protein
MSEFSETILTRKQLVGMLHDLECGKDFIRRAHTIIDMYSHIYSEDERQLAALMQKAFIDIEQASLVTGKMLAESYPQEDDGEID